VALCELESLVSIIEETEDIEEVERREREIDGGRKGRREGGTEGRREGGIARCHGSAAVSLCCRNIMCRNR